MWFEGKLCTVILQPLIIVRCPAKISLFLANRNEMEDNNVMAGKKKKHENCGYTTPNNQYVYTQYTFAHCIHPPKRL